MALRGKARCTVARGVAGLGLCAIVAIGFGGCGGGAEDFCSTFCPAYETCAASHSTSDASLPLFCTREVGADCESLCVDTADGLGDSESDFLDCGECVVSFDAESICDASASGRTGEVSCPDECTADGVGSAAAKFYEDFTASLAQASQGGEVRCNGTGEISWAADDPALAHKTGVPGDGGAWTCSGATDCYYGHIVYGPQLTLPAGDYVAGFFGVSASGPSGSQVVADVNSVAGTLANAQVPAESAPDRIEMQFSLPSQTDGFEVRLTTDGLVDTVTVGGTFVRRL